MTADRDQFTLESAMSSVLELCDKAPAGKAKEFYQTIWDVMKSLSIDVQERQQTRRAHEVMTRRIDFLERLLHTLLKDKEQPELRGVNESSRISITHGNS